MSRYRIEDLNGNRAVIEADTVEVTTSGAIIFRSGGLIHEVVSIFAHGQWSGIVLLKEGEQE